MVTKIMNITQHDFVFAGFLGSDGKGHASLTITPGLNALSAGQAQTVSQLQAASTPGTAAYQQRLSLERVVAAGSLLLIEG